MLRVLDMAEDLGWKAGLPAGVCPAECALFMADLRSSCSAWLDGEELRSPC